MRGDCDQGGYDYCWKSEARRSIDTDTLQLRHCTLQARLQRARARGRPRFQHAEVQRCRKPAAGRTFPVCVRFTARGRRPQHQTNLLSTRTQQLCSLFDAAAGGKFAIFEMSAMLPKRNRHANDAEMEIADQRGSRIHTEARHPLRKIVKRREERRAAKTREWGDARHALISSRFLFFPFTTPDATGTATRSGFRTAGIIYNTL